VLQYAFWAETNPDSIKSLWLEFENKPDDLPISWDNFQVRIIVIAPEILRSTLDIVNKINYQVDLIEVKRWVEGENQLLLVNKLEEDKKHKTTITSGLKIYDKEFYEKEYNKNSAKEFIKYVKEVESIIKENGWPLETKYNKHYCGFKRDFLMPLE
jgi:CRISPR/Cas system-associated exonuclease Cas4 (RecB family)